MVLSDAEEIESDLIGERALVDDLTKGVCLSQLFPFLINGDISKRIKTHFNRLRHLGALSLEVKAEGSTGLLGIGRSEANKLYTLFGCPLRQRARFAPSCSCGVWCRRPLRVATPRCVLRTR